jgi:hypothetical protein
MAAAAVSNVFHHEVIERKLRQLQPANRLFGTAILLTDYSAPTSPNIIYLLFLLPFQMSASALRTIYFYLLYCYCYSHSLHLLFLIKFSDTEDTAVSKKSTTVGLDVELRQQV